jgi:hypothetical protein
VVDETNETTPAPKKATRKPDPLAQLLNEVKRELDSVGKWTVNDRYAYRRRQHDSRASAWGREYAKTGALDALILSLAFELLACFPQEGRHAAVQLAAAALKVAESSEAGE